MREGEGANHRGVAAAPAGVRGGRRRRPADQLARHMMCKHESTRKQVGAASSWAVEGNWSRSTRPRALVCDPNKGLVSWSLRCYHHGGLPPDMRANRSLMIHNQ